MDIEKRAQTKSTSVFKKEVRGFPGGAVVESLPANAGDAGSSPGPGRSHMLRSNWARELNSSPLLDPQIIFLYVLRGI